MLAILADPVFSEDDRRFGRENLTTDEEFRGRSESLSRLPGTAREADALGELFGSERTLRYTGLIANRRNLLSEPVRNAQILHIASHGFFSADTPDNVGLALSISEEGGVKDSGFITLSELFDSQFNNELVVISGCSTALGQNMAGEGLLGLARGFLGQGARQVISTLWPVSDRSSARFMGLFYENLLTSGNVPEALRQAQLTLSQQGAFRHPFHWEAYVLHTVNPGDTISIAPESTKESGV